MSQDEYRYSQDEIWEVDEPDAAKLSESELAEIARLRDSMGKAVEERFKTVPYSPFLSPPKPVAVENKQAAPPKVNVKKSLASIEGVEVFVDRFPDEFAKKEIRDQTLKISKQLAASNETAVLAVICRKMKKIIQLYGLGDDKAFKKPYLKLRLRLLKALYPRTGILFDFWTARAIELNLPPELAKERSLEKTMQTFDPGEDLTPNKRAVRQTFYNEVCKHFKSEKKEADPRHLADGLSLALDAVEALSAFFENSEPNLENPAKKKGEQEEADLKESCTKFGAMSVGILGLETPLKTPMLLTLIFAIIRALENESGQDPNQILEWIGQGAGEAIEDDNLFFQIIPRLAPVVAMINKTGWIEALCPNRAIQQTIKEVAKSFPSLKPVKGGIPEDWKPGKTLVRQFIGNLLGSTYIEDSNEVDYAARSSERA